VFGSVLTIAMTDPTQRFSRWTTIKFMTGFNVEPVVASESAIGDAHHALLWKYIDEPGKKSAT